ALLAAVLLAAVLLAAPAPFAAAAPSGSSAGPPGGSAEAGFGSTGADPGDAAPPWAQAVMPAPTDDPFFHSPAPDRVAGLAPGDVIRHREASTVQIGLPRNDLHQFMFRSTDSHGRPVAATASLLVPDVPAPGPGPRPVVINAAAIDSLGATCTPGYAMVHKPLEFEIPPFTPMMLDRGYAVLVPDHEGPDMAYAAGILAGHIVLDSVRAMRGLPDLPSTGVGEDSRMVLTRYSGGAIAARWAAQLPPHHAPAGELAGAAARGVPAASRPPRH